MSKKVLIVGGNGYIGSQANLYFLEKNVETVVLDRRGPDEFFNPQDQTVVWEKADLMDVSSLQQVFEKYDFECVIHFAALIEVGESQENPELYYQNNLLGTLNLLKVMNESGVKKIVFSSTAATYGIPESFPIMETDPKKPINTYGRTKYMVEQVLEDYTRSYDFSAICLRYFNACGADLLLRTGENHDPESHLMPIIFQVATQKREVLFINGNDYDTKDGTCIRDYVHTLDLASAHHLAFELLQKESGGYFQAINLGTKSGHSILEIYEAAKKITNKEIPTKIGARRSGDPAVLVADNTKAKSLLGWEPKYSNLESILTTSWNWFCKINKIT